MTKKVGLIKYLGIKLRRFLDKRVSLSFNSKTPHLDEYLERRKTTIKQSAGSNSVSIIGNGNVVVNGKKYSGRGKGYTYIKDGKVLEPGTKEYDDFKKEMDAQEKYWAEFAEGMGKMARDMGVSAEQASRNIARSFYDKD